MVPWKINRRQLGFPAGFTLIEILVALMIFGLVIGAIYQLYISNQRTWVSQRLIAETQQSVRVGIDMIHQELIMAGFKSPDENIITIARPREIEFSYHNEDDVKTYKVRYYLQGANLMRAVKEWSGASWEDPTAVPVLTTIVEGIYPHDRNHNGSQDAGEQPDLVFEYYGANNVDLGTYDLSTLAFSPDVDSDGLYDNFEGAANQIKRNLIREISVTLTTRSTRTDPSIRDYRYRTLVSRVRPRNLAIQSSPFDIIPPAPPTGIAACDPNQCGTIDISWDANTEPDLAGYRIYWGQASRGLIPYSKVATVGKNATSYRIGNLQNGFTYYVAVVATDKSANRSDFSAEVSGISGSADTTPTADKPENPTTGTAAVINLGASDGAVENQVNLSWSWPANEDGSICLLGENQEDLAGFRVYRKDSPFTNPATVRPDTDGAVLIADESQIPYNYGQANYSYIDSSGLLGCETYYYAVTAVNACDPTLVDIYTAADFAYAWGDGVDGETDFPTDGATDTTPRDITPLTDPEIAARAGWKRVFLTLVNPHRKGQDASPDFQFTRVYYSVTGYPGFDKKGVLNPADAKLVETVTSDGPGTFSGEGTVTFVHNGTADPAAEGVLNNDSSYYYTAYAFDLCGNTSQRQAVATTLVELCGDDPPGPPATPTIQNTVGCTTPITVSWTSPDFPDLQDHAGFHVERRTISPTVGSWTRLTASPLWMTSFVDAGVEIGKAYEYRVYASDCAVENGSTCLGPDGNPWSCENNKAYSAPVQVAPAGLGFDGTEAIRTGDLEWSPPNFYHNTVRFNVRRRGAAPVALDQVTVDWTRPPLPPSETAPPPDPIRLNRIVAFNSIADYESGVGNELYDGPPVPAGTPITVNYVFGDLSSRVVFFEFTRDDGSLGPEVNLREYSLSIGVTYTNQSTGTSTCTADLEFPVPLGPVITGTVQDQPEPATVCQTTVGKVTVTEWADVLIQTEVIDTGGVGISEVVLRYAVTDLGEISPPPFDDVLEWPDTQKISLNPLVSGGQTYATWDGLSINPIPAQENQRVWFYLTAVDNNGNFDRAPEWGEGIGCYVYDHIPLGGGPSPTPTATPVPGETPVPTPTFTPTPIPCSLSFENFSHTVEVCDGFGSRIKWTGRVVDGSLSVDGAAVTIHTDINGIFYDYSGSTGPTGIFTIYSECRPVINWYQGTAVATDPSTGCRGVWPFTGGTLPAPTPTPTPSCNYTIGWGPEVYHYPPDPASCELYIEGWVEKYLDGVSVPINAADNVYATLDFTVYYTDMTTADYSENVLIDWNWFWWWTVISKPCSMVEKITGTVTVPATADFCTGDSQTFEEFVGGCPLWIDNWSWQPQPDTLESGTWLTCWDSTDTITINKTKIDYTSSDQLIRVSYWYWDTGLSDYVVVPVWGTGGLGNPAGPVGPGTELTFQPGTELFLDCDAVTSSPQWAYFDFQFGSSAPQVYSFDWTIYGTGGEVCTETGIPGFSEPVPTPTPAPNPCDSIPRAPTGLFGATPGDGYTVYLNWNPVTHNTSGIPIIDLAGYKIYQKMFNKLTGALEAEAPIGQVDSGTTTYSFTTPSAIGKEFRFSWYVTAFDTCSPPKESGSSNELTDGDLVPSL